MKLTINENYKVPTIENCDNLGIGTVFYDCANDSYFIIDAECDIPNGRQGYRCSKVELDDEGNISKYLSTMDYIITL